MRLTTLRITAEVARNHGIHECQIERVPQVIAFVGRNGTGKTRILSAIMQSLNSNWSPEQMEQQVQDLPDKVKQAIKAIPPVAIEFINAEAAQPARTNNNLVRAVDISARQRLAKAQSALHSNPHRQTNIEAARTKWHEARAETQKYVIHVPTAELLALSSVTSGPAGTNQSTAYRTLLTGKSEGRKLLFEKLIQGARAFLRDFSHDLADDYFEHIENLDRFVETPNNKQLGVLQGLFKKFLHKELTWTKKRGARTKQEDGVVVKMSGEFLVNNRPFDYDTFSQGEKVLLAYVMFFFLVSQNKDLNLSECIFILDEPEVHLHPEAEISIINSIRELIGSTGQLFIATHSVNIVSHLDVREIFPVRDGQIISPSRNAVGRAIDELFGLDAHSNRLAKFLGDIDNWAFAGFIEQCLSEPEVVLKAPAEDPECNLILTAIAGQKDGCLLLDFGAGHGRVSSRISQQAVVSPNIDALEPNGDYHAHLRAIGIRNIHTNYESLSAGAYDCIFLCGVLHEIPVTHWVETITRIQSALKPDGQLLIVEDLYLPRGEYVNDHGFLVMDTKSLSALLDSDVLIKYEHVDPKYINRIMCVAVDKERIGIVSRDTARAALLLRKESIFSEYAELKKRRPEGPSRMAQGRKLAYLTQQYINLDHALKCLEDTSADPLVTVNVERLGGLPKP